MTDKTNVQGAESNDPIEGVTFIDETIIKKAPGTPLPAPAPSPTPPAPLPVVSKVETAPTQIPVPPPPPVPRALERATPPPRPLPEIAPLMRDIAPTPKPVPPSIPTPVPVAIPTSPPMPMPVAVPSEQKAVSPQFAASMQRDMQKILADVKLPERRIDTAPQKQIPVLPIDETPDAVPAPLPETASLSAKISAEAPNVQAPESSNEHALASVHTLKDDVQHVVRDKKISYVRAAALEEEKKARRGESEDNTPGKRSWASRVLITVAILCVLGAVALGAVFFMQAQKAANVQTPTTNSVMFAEQTVTFPLGNVPASEVKRSLADARARGTFTLGAMTRVVPTISEGDTSTGTLTERQATFREFMSRIGANLSEEFFRAVSEEFFFGIHTVDENAPVIVVPVSSYENAFAGMLAWERSMNVELSPLFTPLPSLTQSPEGLPVERTFTDELMRNYDVRAMKDDAGVIQLFYSFPTRNILIIAESPYSFTEVLSRLRAERKL